MNKPQDQSEKLAWKTPEIQILLIKDTKQVLNPPNTGEQDFGNYS
jgi:hypothetical protein